MAKRTKLKGSEREVYYSLYGLFRDQLGRDPTKKELILRDQIFSNILG